MKFTFQQFFQVRTVENIIAENQCNGIISDELFSDNERLSQPFRFRLDSIGEFHAKAGTIFQKTLETGLIFGSRNDENITDPGEHQHADGIVDHRFVIHTEKLFGYAKSDGMKPRSGSACKYNTFHNIILLFQDVPFCMRRSKHERTSRPCVPSTIQPFS